VISDSFRPASRWVLLAALIFAPWVYGCTSAGEIAMLNGILGTALSLWLASHLLGALGRDIGTSRPDYSGNVPRGLAIVASALLVLGWAMTLNARSIYDSDFFLFVSRRNILPSAPGSVDAAISAAWMLRATLLIGVTLMIIDLTRDSVWLLRLWWTIAITGGSIALLGLIQKATGAAMIFWGPPGPRGPYETFFATYFYHANAGAYLNLVLPLILGQTVWVLMRPSRPAVKAVSLTLALLVIGAVAANTSRMAQLVGAVLLLLLLLGFIRAVLRKRGVIEHKALLLGSLLVVFTLFAIARASHLDQPLKRWSELSSQLPEDARWLAWRAAQRALGDAGWLGFGPGTFRVIFPYYTNGLGSNIEGIWRFLHEDYLQTILEWGWLGSVLWALFFFGGIAVAIRNLLKPGKAVAWRPRYRVLLPVTILALLGIALHGLVDFPFQIASLQLYVAVYLGICWGSTRWEGKDAAVNRRRRKGDTGKKEMRKVKKRRRRLEQPSSRASTAKAVPSERLSTKEPKVGELRRGD
jgi:O-antigen ligase